MGMLTRYQRMAADRLTVEDSKRVWGRHELVWFSVRARVCVRVHEAAEIDSGFM